MNEQRTIVLVLRSGGDFSFRDVELIARHITTKWKSPISPRIICLWDRASMEYDLGNIHLIPLTNELPGTWSRMQLYSPEMEKYRPFLYLDLDTAIIQSVENIFDLVPDPSYFIPIEDLWQKGKLATGMVWFPANSPKISYAWKKYRRPESWRMDYFLQKHIKADVYWQQLTNTLVDFKPFKKDLVTKLPEGTNIVFFHGMPRIHTAAEIIPWVRDYVGVICKTLPDSKKVTVIIPYKTDRGWLKDAIDSVPKEVQLLVSQGEGNWPANFNKVWPQVTGDYVRWLHEDDMLTPNSITDSVAAIEAQGVDFIHGNAIEIYQGSVRTKYWKPVIKHPTIRDMGQRNRLHSAAMLYRREVFDRVGLLDESLKYSEEYEFNMRCLHAGLKLGYCDSFLAYYRRHPKQKIRNVDKRAVLMEHNSFIKRYV